MTAGTADEAAAAEAAGIEMVVCMSQSVPAVREGSNRVFVTAAHRFRRRGLGRQLDGRALTALGDGADAVITARRLEAAPEIRSAISRSR